MLYKSRKRIIYDTTKKYLPRNNGEISTSITKNWTEQAYACYMSNHNCAECAIMNGNYSFVCQMPKVINILLDEIGPPPVDENGRMLA